MFDESRSYLGVTEIMDHGQGHGGNSTRKLTGVVALEGMLTSVCTLAFIVSLLLLLPLSPPLSPPLPELEKEEE